MVIKQFPGSKKPAGILAATLAPLLTVSCLLPFLQSLRRLIIVVKGEKTSVFSSLISQGQNSSLKDQQPQKGTTGGHFWQTGKGSKVTKDVYRQSHSIHSYT